MSFHIKVEKAGRKERNIESGRMRLKRKRVRWSMGPIGGRDRER